MHADLIARLIEAVERLNAACDAMWNDHNRLEINLGWGGQDYRIKEIHVKAISEAQRQLPAILRALTADAGAQGEAECGHPFCGMKCGDAPTADPVQEAARVRVKALCFADGKAKTPFGLYAIGWRGCSQCDVDYGVVTFNGERVFEKHGAEPDELVAAAQADFEARIHAALEDGQ